MKNLVLSCEQVRRLDADAVRELQIPSILLMENAARGAAEEILRENSWRTITIICGPGNNGGDGLALARLLAASDLSAQVLLLRGNKQLTQDAATNLQLLQRSGVHVIEASIPVIDQALRHLSDRDLVVDALLGTGVRGLIRTPFLEAIKSINEHAATVIALDVPSGLDCDLGTPCGDAIKANQTLTFAAMKHGLQAPVAFEYTGPVSVCHIGLPTVWLEAWYERISREDGTFINKLS